MSLLDWFANLFAKEAKHYIFTPVAADMENIIFREGEHYLRLRLTEMFLKDDRKLFRKLVPVVSSVVSLQFGANAAQQLPNVAGPLALNLNEGSLGRGVQLNYSLTNLIPYRGGTVSVDAALLAYVSKDYFHSFITLASSISSLLTIGQLSAALKVADSVAGALQDLLDSGDKDVRLVFHNEYAGSDRLGGVSLTSGYFAVIGAETGKLDPSRLFVKNSRLCSGDKPESAQPLTGYDYMLFSTEAAQFRDDFRYFNEYNSLLYAAIEKGMIDKAEGDAVIRAGMLAVLKSDDLTYVDKARVAAALKAEYEDRLSLLGSQDNLHAGESEWLNNRIAAIDPRVIGQKLSSLLENGQLGSTSITDKILRMLLNGEFG